MDDPRDDLKSGGLFAYSLLAVPLAFAGLPLYMHAPDFYAAHAAASDSGLTHDGLSNGGASLAAIGAVMLFVRIFDAVQDPLIGYYSSKYNHLRPRIMMCAFITMAAGFVMLFHPPQSPVFQSHILLWFGVALVLATTAFSVLSINYNAVGSLWSRDTHDKPRITAWREGAGLIGLLIAAVLPAVFGLPLSSLMFVGLLTLSAIAYTRWHSAHQRIIRDNENHPTPAHTKHGAANAASPIIKNAAKTKTISPQRSVIRRILGRDNFGFFAVYTVSLLASAIPGVLVLFFIRDLLGAEHLTGAFLFVYFLAGAGGMVFWHRLPLRFDKNTVWLMSMIMAVIVFIWAYFLGAGDVWQYGVVCALSGIAFGAELALPPAILSDMIDKKSDQAQTSLYFAALGFLTKTVLALGGFIALTMLDGAGLTPAQDNTDAALQSLSFTYAALPCLIKLISALGLWYLIKQRAIINTA